MSKIKHVFAREILNSKGNPTVEATVVLNDDIKGVASCPSGTSLSSYEAADLKDRDPARFGGMGVLKAVNNVSSVIAPAIVGMDVEKQQEIDKKMIELDGTINKSKLGANSILAVSMACAKAAAKSSRLPLFLYLREFIKKSDQALHVPTPCFNLVNGGKHARGTIDFQEFLLIPASSKSFSDSLEMADSIFFSIKNILEQENESSLIGDEGGFSPRLPTNYDVLKLLMRAIDSSKHRFNYDVFLGLDLAASTFHTGSHYKISDKSSPLSSDELLEYYRNLQKEFKFLYLEDPFAEDDFEAWGKITQEFGNSTLIVGDDLVATNPYRLQIAIEKKAITGVIIKPDQIGTVIETLAVVEVARQLNLKIVVSHRSAETNDDFIADFSVAVSSDYVKFGAPDRGERVAKYNRLWEIETHLKTLK